MFTTIGRRSTCARRIAAEMSRTSVAELRTCSKPAPVGRTIAFWSMSCGCAAIDVGVSPHTRSIDVSFLPASVSAVNVFVSPGPCVTEATPSLPVTRAYPSAIEVALAS